MDLDELLENLTELIKGSELEGDTITDIANHIIERCGGATVVVYEGDSLWRIDTPS